MVAVAFLAVSVVLAVVWRWIVLFCRLRWKRRRMH